ncbi:phosphoglycerate mutase family protein [Nitrospira sp. BLG_2]|uniref:phosphoglycerate mutase family protein n=1 Tax=Nitrospira sp. BLG_2 TaxID=3397507 RepID=UPI003B9C6586
MVPALFIKDRVVTGLHHGDAFSKLSEQEKNDNHLMSGFLDNEHHKFVTEDETIYLKDIILLRHAQNDLRVEDGPITANGRAQAFRAATFLRELHLAGYEGLNSPYIRCQQTSAIIKEICRIPFETDLRLCKQSHYETQEDFLVRITETLDMLPPKSILITHTDFIQNILCLTHLIKEQLKLVVNCSITYIHQNRLIWLAKDINAQENRS